MGCAQSCLAEDQSLDLTSLPDVNGPGVLLSFYSGVALSIASCIAIKVLATQGPLRRFILTSGRVPAGEHDRFAIKATCNLRRFLSSLSDQHLITGIAICLAVYIPICKIQVWQFFAAVHLASVSLSIHLLALHTLRDQIFNSLSQWRCRLRLLFMLVNCVLLSPTLYHIPTAVISTWDVPPDVFPAACLFSGVFHDSLPASGWAVLGVVVLFILLVVTSVASYVLMDFRGKGHRRTWVARVSGGCVVICVTMVIAASAYSVVVWHGSDHNKDHEWTFGQILPTVMVFLMPLGAWTIRNEGDGEQLRQLELQ